MTGLRLVDAGIKGKGLQHLRDIGLLVPETDPFADLDDVIVCLEDPSRWDLSPQWIIRPSPVVPENQAPLLSGLFPSHVLSDPKDIQATVERLRAELYSDATVTRLSLAGISSPRLVFLLQPYLVAAISGIAHVVLSQDPRITWTTGPLAPLAEGKFSGYSLTVRGLPTPWVVRGSANHAPQIALNRTSLLRAAAGLNVARNLAQSSEIEWLVTVSGAFYGLQCQPLTGSLYRDV
jgi:hypothetical protein